MHYSSCVEYFSVLCLPGVISVETKELQKSFYKRSILSKPMLDLFHSFIISINYKLVHCYGLVCPTVCLKS